MMSASPTFTLTTLNACLFPVGMRHSRVFADKDRRLGLLVDAVRGDEPGVASDVVCLQEVFSSSCSSRWRSRIVARDYDAAWGRASCLARGHVMDSGLAVLSRLPIVFDQFVPFEHNPGLLRLADKGFQHVVLAADSSRLVHVINVHLHPTLAGASDAAASRHRQLAQIRAFVDALCLDDDAALLVAGDFNIEQGSDEHQRMLQTLRCAAGPPLGTPTQHMAHPFCNHEQLLCGDFAVGSGLASAAVLRLPGLSDHYPVRYSVTLPASPHASPVSHDDCVLHIAHADC